MVASRTWALLLLASLLGCEMAMAEAQPSAAEVMDDLMYGRGTVGGPFTLTDSSGHKHSDSEFRGKLMIVYFGYTFCPDVCPADLMAITQALDELGPAASGIQPVFITVDPERDTQDVLKDYLSSFDPHVVGLTGDLPSITKVAKEYRAYFKKVPLDGGGYTMDHTAITYLMDREGRFVSPFNLKRTPEAAAADLRRQL